MLSKDEMLSAVNRLITAQRQLCWFEFDREYRFLKPRLEHT